jgi:hypothetical protein
MLDIIQAETNPTFSCVKVGHSWYQIYFVVDRPFAK